MAKLFLLLGTNLGDRAANLERALGELDAALGPHEAVSAVAETRAVGFDGPDFLNCVVRYECRRRPATVLGICKEIEHAMGRRETLEYRPDGSRIYHDRIIDIDILLYGNRVVFTPELTIPHPQVKDRPFVAPLLEEVL